MDHSPASSSPYGHLHSQAKAVIYNVNRYFLEEKGNGAPILPPSKAVARTAMATKISEATVRRICSGFNQSLDKEAAPQKPAFSSPKKKNRAEPVTGFDDFDKCVLRRTVLGSLICGDMATVGESRCPTQTLISRCGEYRHSSLLKAWMFSLQEA